MATRFLFGKLLGVATLVGFGEKRCRKNLPLSDTTFLMRVTSITQQNDPLNSGLAPISMRGLKRIVVLAGANGSGKSRFLARVTNGAHPSNQGNVHGQGFLLENPIPKTAPVPFVSKNLNLIDPSTQTAQNVVNYAKQAESPGASQLSSATLSYIQRVQTHWWNSTHPNSQEPETSRNEKRQAYESLCELIQTCLLYTSPSPRD